MGARYIELDDITHLRPPNQVRTRDAYNNKFWRESYYFCMSNNRSGIKLITTIGILPNRKLVTGFFLFIHQDQVLVLRPLVEYNRPQFYDYNFKVKGLEYMIEGINWRLIYDSGKIKFNILFSPINKIYPYITDVSDQIFSRIGSQHYEQFGVFQGVLQINGKKVDIGPCLGHRDHSWGIRDWSSVDYYRLFCCAFSKRFAINLWEGSIGGKGFLKGYVFDGHENVDILNSHVETRYGKNGKEPQGAVIVIKDAKGRRFKIDSRTKVSIPVPPRQSVLYETIAEMTTNGMAGQGLCEYLYHETNPLKRFWIFIKLLNWL